MKIEYKDDNKVEFKDLECGECFIWFGNVYMKIAQYDDEGCYPINACNLFNGNGYYYTNNIKVKRVSASVTVNNVESDAKPERLFLIIKCEDGKRYIAGYVKSDTYPSSLKEEDKEICNIIELREECHINIDGHKL